MTLKEKADILNDLWAKAERELQQIGPIAKCEVQAPRFGVNGKLMFMIGSDKWRIYASVNQDVKPILETPLEVRKGMAKHFCHLKEVCITNARADDNTLDESIMELQEVLGQPDASAAGTSAKIFREWVAYLVDMYIAGKRSFEIEDSFPEQCRLDLDDILEIIGHKWEDFQAYSPATEAGIATMISRAPK